MSDRQQTNTDSALIPLEPLGKSPTNTYTHWHTPYRIRRKRVRLPSNDPIETAPTKTPVHNHALFGAVPIGIYRLSFTIQRDLFIKAASGSRAHFIPLWPARVTYPI
jgi:hypothetical protein